MSAEDGAIDIHKCQICMTVYQSQKELKEHRNTQEHSQKVMQMAQKYSSQEKKDKKETK